jgi:hypothetical protein
MAGGGIVSFRDGGNVIRAANGLPEGMFQGDASQSDQPTMKGLIPAFTENVGKGYEFYEDYFRGGIYKDLEQLKRLGYTDAQISQMSPEIRAYVSKSTRAPVFGASDAPVTPVVPAAVRPTVTPAPGGAPPAPPPSRDTRSAFATLPPVTIPERQSDYAIQTARAQRLSDYEQAVPDRLTPFLQEAITKREGDIEGRRGSNINEALIQAGLGMMGTKSPNFLQGISEGGLGGLKVYREGAKDIRQSEESLLSARAKMMEAQSLRDQNKFKIADDVEKQARDEYKLGIDLARTQSAIALQDMQARIAAAKAPAEIGLLEAQADYARSGGRTAAADQKAADDYAKSKLLMSGILPNSPDYMTQYANFRNEYLTSIAGGGGVTQIPVAPAGGAGGARFVGFEGS